MEKDLSYYVKSYKMISDDDCKRIVKKIEGVDWKQHEFYDVHSGESSDRSGDKELDVGYIHFSEEDQEGWELRSLVMEAIWKSYKSYVTDLNLGWWSSWEGFSEVRFNRYKETRLMAEHCDHIHSLFDGQRKGIPTMTALGLLNEEYEGGEFVMWEDVVLPFKAGEIKIFPSCFLYPHRIDPVNFGTRYSFVSWAW
jgi:hypothetical protein